MPPLDEIVRQGLGTQVHTEAPFALVTPLMRKLEPLAASDPAALAVVAKLMLRLRDSQALHAWQRLRELVAQGKLQDAQGAVAYYSGVCAVQTGQADAAEHFANVLEAPDSSLHHRAHFELGRLAVARQDIDSARLHFETVLALGGGSQYPEADRALKAIEALADDVDHEGLESAQIDVDAEKRQ